MSAEERSARDPTKAPVQPSEDSTGMALVDFCVQLDECTPTVSITVSLGSQTRKRTGMHSSDLSCKSALTPQLVSHSTESEVVISKDQCRQTL